MQTQEEKLANLFYNENDGFISLNQFLIQAKKLGIKNLQASRWYANQKINQVTHPLKENRNDYVQIKVPCVGYIEADLMDYKQYYRQNKGNRYIFTAIDKYSRYAWVFSIRNKMPSDVYTHLIKIKNDLKKNDYSWLTITIDRGKI